MEIASCKDLIMALHVKELAMALPFLPLADLNKVIFLVGVFMYIDFDGKATIHSP
jgi:hypothetical protein